MTKSVYSQREVYIVDGARTPFLKARGKPGPFTGSDLATSTMKQLLARQSFEPCELDEVIVGAAMPGPDEANIGRVVGLRVGTGNKVPAWTVMRNCASGMQALDCAATNISLGRSDLVLAGGVDAMSHAPVLYNEQAVKWFGKMAGARSFTDKLKTFAKLNPKHFFAPVIALMRGLTDPVVGINMGQTAEEVAYKFGISRKEMDTFAVQSHQRLLKAQKENLLPEITPLFDTKGNVYQMDDGVRADSSVENLQKLKPYFDKKFGAVTAANSSQITDGAASLILASGAAVKKYKLKVLGKIVDCAWAGLAPEVMGLGPVYASSELLKRHALALNDIDYWEINEAFAAQVLGCIKAFDDETFCKTQLGLKDKLGQIDQSRLNIYGGAICIGHPIGASGARIVLQLLNALRRNQAKRGIATLCIGGGQGGAMLIETCDDIKPQSATGEK